MAVKILQNEFFEKFFDESVAEDFLHLMMPHTTFFRTW